MAGAVLVLTSLLRRNTHMTVGVVEDHMQMVEMMQWWVWAQDTEAVETPVEVYRVEAEGQS